MKPDTPTAPLDPAIVEMERRWKESGVPGLYEGGNGPVSRERARNIRAFLYPKPRLPTGEIEQLEIEGPAGALPIRLVWPVDGVAKGTLVYFHGGGWVVGDLDSHEAHAIRIANRTGLVVANVDYRLAPEHPFPAGVEDAFAAIRWAAANLVRLGGRGRPLAVGGDSAGGNLSAVMGWMCRDVGIALSGQLLMYPATDLSKGRDDDVRRAYFSGRFAEFARDPRASPVFANLAGVSPTIIGVGPYDFLYKNNLDYAQALENAGVQTLLRIFPSLNHGFFSYAAISKPCEAAADSLCDDLKSLLKL